MKIHSIGDQIRAGTYTVRSRFNRSVLLLGPADRALFAVDHSIGEGPLNLVVSNPNAFVQEDRLHMPPECPAPVFDSKMPLLSEEKRHALLRVLQSALPRLAPPESLVSLLAPVNHLPRQQQNRDALFQKAFGHVAAQRIADAARLIRGCGEGLTPSGDDFLCGWMLALRLQGNTAQARYLLPHALGQNAVSNAFLEMAAKGRVNGPVKLLLAAPTAARVRTVCAFGHSSGADLLCGMWFGLIRQ